MYELPANKPKQWFDLNGIDLWAYCDPFYTSTYLIRENKYSLFRFENIFRYEMNLGHVTRLKFVVADLSMTNSLAQKFWNGIYFSE